MRKEDKALSSPSPEKRIDSKGDPKQGVHGVPGYKGGTGTPSWASKPAASAARKAK